MIVVKFSIFLVFSHSSNFRTQLQTNLYALKHVRMEKLRRFQESSAQCAPNEFTLISLGHSVQAQTSDETG